MLFGKKIKPVPREITPKFDGFAVKRIQFNNTGGFKVTVLAGDKEEVWWVPNDRANTHCAYIMNWIAQGGFPEDADQISQPKILGLSHRTWSVVGQCLLVVGALLGGVAGILAVAK